MSSQRFIMNVEQAGQTSASGAKPATKDKLMSYEEKSVGSTAFFKCEACPYMALAEDDIKFHLFTEHPDLAKSNGLADNIQIACPGCSSVFDAEETLRNHLRNHHKMGIKDVKKMVKSLIQLALKNAKLKKEDNVCIPQPQQKVDVSIPQVIEIVPDVVNATSEPNSLPKGVAFISVDELQKMRTPNFEKVDPKEIIQEASINIVYTNEVPTQYINVTSAVTPVTSCNVLQMSSVTPDLISSIQPRVPMNTTTLTSSQSKEQANPAPVHPGRPVGSKTTMYHARNKQSKVKKQKEPVEIIEACAVNNCWVRLRDAEKMKYHRKCHQNGKLQCPDCPNIFKDVDSLHTHLWKLHKIDLELPTCEICGYKNAKKHKLYNVHMKCHGDAKNYACTQCPKSFKNANQLSKHKCVHKQEMSCSICHMKFTNNRRLRIHIAAVHEGLRPFKCSHCDYTAARKEEMKLHSRSHTGVKPYSCDQCSYRSSDHNAMRRHKKMHTKDSLYKCKYCPYSSIQSTMFASHMISKHPNVNSNDVYRCPYCVFKSVSKEKYIRHLTKHTDKEGVQLLIEMTKNKTNKLSWTIPSETEKKTDETAEEPKQDEEATPKTVNTIPIEVFDCDSLSESLTQNFPKNYCMTTNDKQQTDFETQVATYLSKDDNNSDCLISESSNDTLRHQFPTQHTLQNLTYDNTQTNLHGYLNSSVEMDQSLCPNSTVSSLVSSHSVMGGSMINNIMPNFPIRLPPVPRMSMSNNITLNPVHTISIPMTKVTGPIIKPTQILPVPSSSNSPVNIFNEPDGMPRKKPKISVKSNLILKGPDQENMFHSQQKMAFKRLEDNERFGLGAVTFNNLITTQFMQLQPEPELSESPTNIIPYPQETLLHDAATPPADTADNSQLFNFNNQMNVNSITLLPTPQKIQTNDPSYIKIEATIKQNTQSPSLERMCNANILNNQSLSREYKASPPLEDIHKNLNEIKNEVKSDSFYNMALNNTTTNPSIIDQYLIDNIIGEQYSGHMDLSAAALSEVSDDPQNDVIEIDDNSDDNKLLSRYDINFPLESLYLMHNDFHFLENDVPINNLPVEVNEANRIVTEVPIINQKEAPMAQDSSSNDYPNFIQGKKDPMMNTSVRQSVNKINVKNIELMKN
ncbi:uncharacterized protein [Choristoneura fumiferana]|uniref:uncharacterized protein n=1 Tax=Choristoneura fumiferana TaxID=7141 RepID=UPI003D157CCF